MEIKIEKENKKNTDGWPSGIAIKLYTYCLWFKHFSTSDLYCSYSHEQYEEQKKNIEKIQMLLKVSHVNYNALLKLMSQLYT